MTQLDIIIDDSNNNVIYAKDIKKFLNSIDDDAVLVKDTHGMTGSDFTLPARTVKILYMEDHDGIPYMEDFKPKKSLLIEVR